jgi:hypothetical protein
VQAFRCSVDLREQAIQPERYSEAVNEILDYWAGGDPQRIRLRAALLSRFGVDLDPRQPNADLQNRRDTVAGENERGRDIRLGLVEQRTVPLLRSCAEHLAVLYAADDLRRVYVGADGRPDENASDVLGDMHDRGYLAPTLLLLDALVCVLRTCCLLVRWCEPLRCLVYEIVYPHLVRVDNDPTWPARPDLARAVAYSEVSEEGQTAWVAYLSPRFHGGKGGIARYRASDAFPIPSTAVVEPSGFDGPSWSPLVWAWAEPPVGACFLPPWTDLASENLELDCALSWLAYLANLQTCGIPVSHGSCSHVPSALSPTQPWHFDDPAGGLDFAKPGADLATALSVAEKLMQVGALMRHLAPDAVTMDRPSIQTGVAKLVEQAPLVEARNRRALMGSRWEADLFRAERSVLQAFAPPELQIDQGTRLVMAWGELRVPVDRQKQLAELKAAVDQELITLDDAIAEFWGVSREAATAKMKEIRASRGAPPAELAQDAVEPPPTEPAIDPEESESAPREAEA